MRQVPIIILFLLFLSPLVGCDSEQSALRLPVSPKELLLYCGTTMAPAMRHIADLFEQQECCVVKIIRDGSGALQHSIHVNRVGDLYLPGSESYVEKCGNEGLVVEAHAIGINRAVLMVAPGNPLHISGDLNNFVAASYRTVLGLPQSGSIGLETQRLLSALGIYKQAVVQANVLARDSKDIFQAVAGGEVDLALNWYATAVSADNKAVEVLEVENVVAAPHILRLALLKYSYDPVLAKKFILFVLSPVGQQILTEYVFKEPNFRGQL